MGAKAKKWKDKRSVKTELDKQIEAMIAMNKTLLEIALHQSNRG